MKLTRDEFEAVRVELARELVLRRRKYPEWVAAGRMKQEQADRQIRLMQTAYDWICEQLPTTAALLK